MELLFFFSCLLIALSHQPNVAFAVERISTRDGRLLLCKLDVGEKYEQGNKQYFVISKSKLLTSRLPQKRKIEGEVEPASVIYFTASQC